MSERIVFIGTYTQPILFGTGQVLQGKGKGIYRFRFERETGILWPCGEAAQTSNPSYFAFSACGGYLYAINELKEFHSSPGGGVSAYRIDRETRKLIYLNSQLSHGTDPCHVILNARGTHAYVSNFMSGSVCVLPILQDGSLGGASQIIQHEGSSINTQRQAGPHAHSLIFDAKGKLAMVPDLGLDKAMLYAVDDTRLLKTHRVPHISVTPGAGPRHSVFHPNGRYCYLINELVCTILVLAYDEQRGEFSEIQHVPSTYRQDGANTCADIHITPDGRFLYGSNRGHDSIIIYAVDAESGRLTYVDTCACGGRTPRSFTVDPAGEYILVCNQDSDNIAVFRIDARTGGLTQVSEAGIPTPVCVKFYNV